MDDQPTATPAESVGRLIRSLDRATLATAQQDDGGWPYGSLVMVATDHAGAPLLLLSDLAEHTRNIKQDDRVSLLFDGTRGLADPLTGARATLLARAAITERPVDRTRYMARHPSAAGFIDFGDFNLYRLTPTRAHLVAGFGEIHWIDWTEIGIDAPATLIDAEADIVAHMNRDHHEAVVLYATQLLGLDGGDWQLTGLDRRGVDLRCGGQVGRLEFDNSVVDAESARVELVRLVKRARRQGET